VLHTVPKSWEAGQSDGQRWRWALAQAAENAPRLLNRTRWSLGSFLHSQFGVQTMQQGRFLRGLALPAEGDAAKDESGTYALHTLGQNETIARLAIGIKRFQLPDEFNFIRIFQQIDLEPQTGFGENAVNTLAQIFENRRQYDTAAEYWKRSIDLYGAAETTGNGSVWTRSSATGGGSSRR